MTTGGGANNSKNDSLCEQSRTEAARQESYFVLAVLALCLHFKGWHSSEFSALPSTLLALLGLLFGSSIYT